MSPSISLLSYPLSMESIPTLLLLSIILCLLLSYLLLRPRPSPKLPPGPLPLPVIGNLHQIGQNPHQSLTRLAKTYGPIMYLKLGSIRTVVISSPELAKQVLQKHDSVLSGRQQPAVTSALHHHDLSVAWLPANARWRTLRRICKDHIFSIQKLDSSQGLRREKLNKLCHYVQECCGAGQVVDFADAAFTTSLNLISATLFSMDFAEFQSDSSKELKSNVHGLMAIVASPNLADFFPVLKRVDPQGLRQKAESYLKKLFRIFDGIIEKRLESGPTESHDMVESLLEISRKNVFEFSRNDILHLLLDLFLAGIDTTSTFTEWTIAELIHNPKVMAKARKELHTVIGTNQQIEESAISKLPYLQAVVKETFRLHPPGPLLIPHKAEADAEINGYIIPKNAQVLVNAWALGRDCSIWSNPDHFTPERFLDSIIDVKGQDFELIPFGSGRRMCPGMQMAQRMVHLMVASLVQKFDWRVEGGIDGEEINMDEKFELSLQRAVPLKAIPVRI